MKLTLRGAHPVSVEVVNNATGASMISITSEIESVQPAPLDAIRLTVYIPIAEYVCVGEVELELLRSPKFQVKDVPPVVLFVKVMPVFLHPMLSLLKFTTGNELTVTVETAVVEHPVVVFVPVTVNVVVDGGVTLIESDVSPVFHI